MVICNTGASVLDKGSFLMKVGIGIRVEVMARVQRESGGIADGKVELKGRGVVCMLEGG